MTERCQWMIDAERSHSMLGCVAITEINSKFRRCAFARFLVNESYIRTVIVSIVNGAPLTALAGCRRNIQSRTRDRNTTDVLFLACAELNCEIHCMTIRIQILHHLRWKLHAMWLVSVKMTGRQERMHAATTYVSVVRCPDSNRTRQVIYPLVVVSDDRVIVVVGVQ